MAAGGLGTLAMDGSLFRRYRHDGGDAAFPDWEFSEGLDDWENALAPALVAKRLLEGVLGHELSPRYARALNNLTHWGFGLASGAAYGLVLGSRRKPKVWFGLPFGAAVWAGGYIVLPLFGVYKPISERLRDAAEGPERHLVFGTSTAATFWLLTINQRRSQ